MAATIDRAALTELSARCSGVLLSPADAGYDEARRVHNGLVDKRPALIARCRGVADVADAVTFARDARPRDRGPRRRPQRRRHARSATAA